MTGGWPDAAVQPPFVLKDLRGDNVTNVGWAILLPKPSFANADCPLLDHSGHC